MCTQWEVYVKILMKYGERRGSTRSAIALRLQDLPFKLPWKREAILQKIKDNHDKYMYGENNKAVNFKNGKSKATIIYLDSFSAPYKEKLISSKFLCR